MSSISRTSQISKSWSKPDPEPYSTFSWAHPDNQNTGCPDSSMSSTKATGCWDFLQNGKNTTTTHGLKQTATNPSIFLLSTKGLDMCTEILGSESGSCIDPSFDICSDNTQERQYSSNIKPREIGKKTKQTSSFPPPLTSITSVKVEAQRGGGRLVITILASSSACSVERENGRLRVFLHKDYYYIRSDQRNNKESGRKIRRNYKCGDESGNKSLTSLPLCVAFT
ncbi:protein FANTASTIC FOUR 4-like [Salvia hispanica]|uniref:protein FANTASTIC FOUR 4-like n=1 Tax=Salvia hispanica TaxID=49212 RepID=UPI002009619B|nr:protein FANTASTIC FOUR 4-like [Salvia hispanica]